MTVVFVMYKLLRLCNVCRDMVNDSMGAIGRSATVCFVVVVLLFRQLCGDISLQGTTKTKWAWDIFFYKYFSFLLS